MSLLRNNEIRCFLLKYLLLMGIAFIAAVFSNAQAAVLVLTVSVVSLLLFMRLTRKRYQAIADLSNRIDQILHGNYNVNLIPDEEGELAVLGSELSKMTLRLREQAERLEKDKRYLSDSLADISHQLRTPLTSIRMLVPRLTNANQSAEQEANIRKVDTLLDRTQWLISTLLKIARIESGTVAFASETVLVENLMRTSLEPLEILLDIKNIELKYKVDNHAAYTGDLLWSAEAIGNILKNGIEHCTEGGSLEIAAHENPIYTEIMIADNGNGFEEKEIPHLFDRFYRGRNAAKESAGIGLNLSRMIISKQNGVITAANGVHGGACFTIRFYKGAI